MTQNTVPRQASPSTPQETVVQTPNQQKSDMMAVWANLAPPLSSFLVLNMKDQSPFVRFYAMQGAILGVVCLAGALLSGFLSVIFIGLLLGPLVMIAYFYFWIVLMYKANSGIEYEIPYIGKMARERLSKM